MAEGFSEVGSQSKTGQLLRDLELKSRWASFDSEQVADMAADNLLSKAVRDLANGNLSRAEAYIEKALRLPVSTQREGPAAQASAHLALFTMLSDEIEIDEHEDDDSGWLDWALGVLKECGELAALDLKWALTEVALDYELDPRKQKRIRAAVGPKDPEQTLERLLASGEASVDDLVRQTLNAVVLFHRVGE